ncbi:MAG TPA: hypothetical protein VK971_07295 [Thiohalobacter sp.]|nr:hypothetical protein [Thiohalobacter sp.]
MRTGAEFRARRAGEQLRCCHLSSPWAAETYASYEARVAELERENDALRQQLNALRQRQSDQAGAEDADSREAMREELKALQQRIERLLQDL